RVVAEAMVGKQADKLAPEKRTALPTRNNQRRPAINLSFRQLWVAREEVPLAIRLRPPPPPARLAKRALPPIKPQVHPAPLRPARRSVRSAAMLRRNRLVQ